MSETDRILDFLGGRRAISGAGTRAEIDFVPALRRGLSVSAFKNATAVLQMPASDLTRYLGLKRRTLTRRKSRLSPVESSRLFRLARIFARAEQVLDGPGAAAKWLRRPQRALGGEVPLALLDTDAGALAVERLIGRIEDAVVT